MPYFRDRNLEDQQNQDQGGNVQLSGAGTTVGPSGDPNQQSSSQTGSGSHFANIDNYLQNNNGAALGQQVGQKVQGSLDQARQGVDTATGEVRNQIQQAPGAASLDQINQAVQKAGAGTTADDAKQYQNWTSQQYQGPNSIADNQAAQSRAMGGISKAKAEANAVQTEPGRFSLLDQYFGRPNYSFGQKSLDNLLVQGGGGLGNTKQYQDQASQLGAYEKQQEQGLVSQAAQKKGDIDTSRLNARSAIGLQDDGTIKGGAIGNLQSDLDARVAAAGASRDQQYQGILDDLKDYNVTPETLAATGLKAGGEHTYDLDFSNYLNKAIDPTRSNVANAGDYSRYKALSQLAGVDPAYLQDTNLAQAGTYDPKSTFDADRFEADRNTSAAQYNNALMNLQDMQFNRDHPGLYRSSNPMPDSEANASSLEDFYDKFYSDPNSAVAVKEKQELADLQKAYGRNNQLYARSPGEPELDDENRLKNIKRSV